jgi:beta-lactamase superfamily II metal-dependent hydrolase
MENTMASRQKASNTASKKTRPKKPRPSRVPRTVWAGDAREPVAVTSNGVGQPKATVRFYCQGIGDCHLIRFPKDDGGDFWMLIDCGIHNSVTGGTEKIKRIVKNIRSLTARLDVVVLTHEHWDHISGFWAAKEEFQGIDVGELWLAWTEDSRDPQAREFDKFKGAALDALREASERLDQVERLGSHLSAIKTGLQAVLGFNFGAKGERVRSARDAAIELAKRRVKYLEPKTPPISLPALAKSVRIYVLGPPRDGAMLGITERASEMYGLGTPSGWPIARALGNAFGAIQNQADPDLINPSDPDLTAPFDPAEGRTLSLLRSPRSRVSNDPRVKKAAEFLHDFYDGPVKLPETKQKNQKKPADTKEKADQSWRRIDHDWLGVSADLAIQLDDRTNNSSLVLAFEFVDTKRVMLFVGDAQIGNWLSWDKVSWTGDPTKVADLLRRTVFYKVGHHGSHNATPKQHGLELMTSSDLSAFIPTNEQDAKKVKWGEMPFKLILEDLQKRTSQRVIRADDLWLADAEGKPTYGDSSGAILATRHGDDGLWVELDLA